MTDTHGLAMTQGLMFGIRKDPIGSDCVRWEVWAGETLVGCGTVDGRLPYGMAASGTPPTEDLAMRKIQEYVSGFINSLRWQLGK